MDTDCCTDLLMFCVPDPSSITEWNHLTCQSRGIIVDYRQDSGCIYYPLNHYTPTISTPSWPMDTPQKHADDVVLVHVYKYNGKVCLSGEKSWECSDVMTNTCLGACDLEKLDFEQYYHVLGLMKGTQLVMMAVRSKITLEIMGKDVMAVEATNAKLDIYHW